MDAIIDIAIIGGGPAGLAAGLYAARGGANVVLFEELFPGGQAAKTEQIDNYPGFPEGVEGTSLGMNLHQQAQRFGLVTQYLAVEQLKLQEEKKQIYTAEGIFEAKQVILAMGAQPRKLGVAREEELTGAGISYCATCDGAFFRGKPVAVVGGGDTAAVDALYLARFTPMVYLIHRRDSLRASKVLQERILQEPAIQLVWNSRVAELTGDSALAGIGVENVQDSSRRELAVAGLFVAVGILPRTALVKDQVRLAADGSIATNVMMQTSIPGVYAVGDVRETPLRQVVTAVADGAVAATAALESLS